MTSGLPNAQSNAQPNAQPDPAIPELSLRMWVSIVLLGVGAGLTSGLLMRLLRLVQHLSYGYWQGDFLNGVRDAAPIRRLGVMVLAGVFAGASLWLLRRVAGNTGGELTSAIWHENGVFRALPMVAKSLISIVIVGMGAAIGREAALKDVGGTVATKLADWVTLSQPQRRLLVACGAGAGMAAAYNVPLGGALFAAEVLLGSVALVNILPALAASVVAVAVSWLMLPNEPTFQVSTLEVTPMLLLWSVLAGPLIGVASAGYVRFIKWAENNRPEGWLAAVAPVVVFCALGLGAMRVPEILGNGKGVVQEAFSSRLAPALLAWLLVLRPLATAFCLKAGAPGGLFTPTITFGALLGGLFGEAAAPFAHQSGQRSSLPSGHESYAILGAGAMLAAASQGPISSVVFMLELTDHTNALIVPLMLAAAGATLVARRLDVHSIYSVRG